MSFAYGYDINSLTPDDMLTIPCPVCGTTGMCVQVGTPMRVQRNDWHAERKYAVLAEKEAKRLVIAEQARQAEEASDAVEIGEVEENHLGEHPEGNSRGETSEAGSGDSAPQEPGEEISGNAA